MRIEGTIFPHDAYDPPNLKVSGLRKPEPSEGSRSGFGFPSPNEAKTCQQRVTSMVAGE